MQKKATPAPKLPKDKYVKVQPKIPKGVIVSIIAVVVVIIGIIILTTPSNEKAIYDAYKDNATSAFTEDHPFFQMNYRDGLLSKGIKSRIESEEVVIVFVGFSTCPSCQAHVGAIEQFFNEENMSQYVDNIYYLNLVVDANGFDALRLEVPAVLETVPQILTFHNGELIDIFTPVSSESAQDINLSVRDYFRAVKTQINQ